MIIVHFQIICICVCLLTLFQIPLALRIRKDFLAAPEWLQRTLQVPHAALVPFQSVFVQRLIFHGYPERVQASVTGVRSLLWLRILFVAATVPPVVIGAVWIGAGTNGLSFLLIGGVAAIYIAQAVKKKWPHVPEQAE